jgi:hypothetical protein
MADEYNTNSHSHPPNGATRPKRILNVFDDDEEEDEQNLMKGVVTLIKILYKSSLSKSSQRSINQHSELAIIVCDDGQLWDKRYPKLKKELHSIMLENGLQHRRIQGGCKWAIAH